ncbi:hypothetical protein, partial [Eudoraea sp.]
MSDQLFIFFAGIALTTGLSYVGLGIVHKIYRANFIFGLFAIASGLYFILISSEPLSPEFTLFFATAMFALFPWYFAFEVGYVNRKLLWIITGLCAGYFAAINLVSYYELPEIQYFFSYGVYILT